MLPLPKSFTVNLRRQAVDAAGAVATVAAGGGRGQDSHPICEVSSN